ncbi:winged helix-turn-helix domain-containing protein [Streptomyces sp. E11-3]|uniref:winged helix-turn-helix domain-containing protein n=1 Tax=Streptomyces sp. E11-3 TaxID=3110112 RepID=UPI00397EB07C
MPESPEPTALYRYFDVDDVLLYVGISNKPDFRAKAHLYESRRDDWPRRAVRRSVEWRDSRPLALAAEEQAIKAERPRYNWKHNYDDAPFDPSSWPEVTAWPRVPSIADLMRGEITNGRWGPGQRIPSLTTLGKATGVSSRIVSQASALLQGEGLLDFQPGRGLFVTRPQGPRLKLPHDWPRSYGFPG